MSFRSANERKFIPAWFWILVVGLPLLILLRWLVRWFTCPNYRRTSAVEIETDRNKTGSLKISRDDLTALKGIGPKTAEILYQAGILSYQQLGLIQLEKLEEILREHSLPAASGAFWKQQAALAAAGDWDGLEKTQKR
jgi:hypothetical protein